MKQIDIREERREFIEKITTKLESEGIDEVRVNAMEYSLGEILPYEIQVMKPSEVEEDKYPYQSVNICKMKSYGKGVDDRGKYTTVERCTNTEEIGESFLRLITGKYDRKYPCEDKQYAKD